MGSAQVRRKQDNVAALLAERRHPSRPSNAKKERNVIEYRLNEPLETGDVIRVFESSGIVRPTANRDRIARMFAGANCVISAWSDQQLVGICRALSDHAYCCYLSDLAVCKSHQRQGIGSGLLAELKKSQGDEVSIILLSAPAAMAYYPTQGFSAIDNGFILRRLR